VPIGTAAVPMTEPVMLGEFFGGKAMDDRACFAAIVLALQELGDTKLDVDLLICATTQEEVGLRSAASAAFDFAPDYALIVDVDFAKSPDSKPHQGKALGSGVVIARGMNMNRDLVDKIIDVAKRGEIPCTITVEPGGNSGTNAKVLQTVRGGVATALLSVPLRYMHTPTETLSLRDIEALGHLLCKTLTEVDFYA